MTISVNDAFVQNAHEEVIAAARNDGAGRNFLRMSERHVDGHWRRFVPKLEVFSRPLAGSIFVDYGSKFGHLTPLLIDQGVKKIFAVDVNDDYLDQGARFFGTRFPVDYLKSEDCYIDIPSASVDLVLANEMISHINPAFLDTFYAEVARVLKPDGELVISDGNNWAHLQTRLDLLDWYGRWDGGRSKEFGENNYGLMRRQVIAERYPAIDAADLDYLAKNTSGMHGPRLFRQVERYLAGERFIERPHRPGVYPTHPRHGVVMERAFDPRQVLIALETYGIGAVQILRGKPLHDDRRRGETKNFTIRGRKLPESVEALAEHARRTLVKTTNVQARSLRKRTKQTIKKRLTVMRGSRIARFLGVGHEGRA